MYNSPLTSAAPIKRTAVERQVNVQIVFLFILLLALSIGSSIGGSIRAWFFASQQWYLFEPVSAAGRGNYRHTFVSQC
jgi:phospholipid-transporting ATPase